MHVKYSTDSVDQCQSVTSVAEMKHVEPALRPAWHHVKSDPETGCLLPSTACCAIDGIVICRRVYHSTHAPVQAPMFLIFCPRPLHHQQASVQYHLDHYSRPLRRAGDDHPVHLYTRRY
jgi:hypothetical protein